MSDPLPRSRPRRILQRASNLLTTNNDNPGSAFEDIILEQDIPGQSPPGRVSFSSSNGLRASIRRKLQEAKDTRIVRSISLRSASSASRTSDSVDGKIERHLRAFSVSESARPRALAPDSINVPESFPIEAPDNRFASGVVPQHHLQPPQSKLTPTTPMTDVVVPDVLQQGVSMTKVSAKRQKSFVFRLDPDQGQILWESKKSKLSMCSKSLI